jgi:hypothetical protein
MTADADEAASRFKRLEQLKRECAKTCGLTVNNDRVGMIAALQLQAELITERMIASGDPGAADALTALNKAISDQMPPIPEPPTEVKVTFVGGPGDSRCPQCGWQSKQSLEEAQQAERDKIRREAEAAAKARGEPVTIDLKAEHVRSHSTLRRKSGTSPATSALPPKADIVHGSGDVR